MSMEDTFRAIVREEVAELRALLKQALESTGRGGPGGEQFLTVAQAATFACAGDSTVREWIRTGKLNRYGSGRTVLVKREELARMLTAPKPVRRNSDADLEARAEQLARGH